MKHRLILLLRLFTGLADIKKGIWNPYGPPTIYKLIERLEKKGIPAHVIFLEKEKSTSFGLRTPREIQLERFEHIQFSLITYGRITGIERIDTFINDLWQLFWSLVNVTKSKPAVVYCVRASQYIGAFIAFFTRCRVVLRLMGDGGAYAFYKKKTNLLLHPVAICSLKAPFSYIISSIDGSRVKKLVDEYAARGVKHVQLINGVDLLNGTSRRREIVPPVKILFVARLSEDKGAEELWEVLRLAARESGDFRVTVVGYGEKEKTLAEKIPEYGLQGKVMMAGKVAHGDMQRYYLEHDIYISLNKRGNMSNTVLEALNAGCCLMILGRNQNGIDEDTEKLIPKDCAIRINPDRITEDLSRQLIHIVNRYSAIKDYQLNAERLSGQLLKSWDERIDAEIDLLTSLEKGNN